MNLPSSDATSSLSPSPHTPRGRHTPPPSQRPSGTELVWHSRPKSLNLQSNVQQDASVSLPTVGSMPSSHCSPSSTPGFSPQVGTGTGRQTSPSQNELSAH